LYEHRALWERNSFRLGRIPFDVVQGQTTDRSRSLPTSIRRRRLCCILENWTNIFPKQSIDSVQAANPEVPVFWYDADRGFNCNDRASYNAEATKLAKERSLEFLEKHLWLIFPRTFLWHPAKADLVKSDDNAKYSRFSALTARPPILTRRPIVPDRRHIPRPHH
jgi:hypothetical protein